MTVYWLIKNENQTREVALKVVESHIEASENCEFDSVRVYNGIIFMFEIVYLLSISILKLFLISHNISILKTFTTSNSVYKNAKGNTR